MQVNHNVVRAGLIYYSEPHKAAYCGLTLIVSAAYRIIIFYGIHQRLVHHGSSTSVAFIVGSGKPWPAVVA